MKTIHIRVLRRPCNHHKWEPLEAQGSEIQEVPVHDGETPTLSERVKSGHLWTPQIRPFRRPETGVEFYFTASCVCKVVWILVRQLRGPHFSTCA